MSITPQASARLGANHGYLIDGDVARLHAEIEVLDHVPAIRHWALQLWACERPHTGGAVSGVIVAEAKLPRTAEAQGASRWLDAEAQARVPGGLRDYAMVLVLTSGDGQTVQVHDFANYPARQRFLTPHLEGSAGYRIDGEHIVLMTDAVRNPRGVDNLSGSLGLELWALPEPYRGGRVDGQLMASVGLGRIAGQSALSDVTERTRFQAPSAGRWHVVLMLREWTEAAGYVTRDYACFEVPYEGAREVPAPRDADAAAAATKPRDEARATAAARTTGVSVNHATADELAAIKGLSRTLAREIVKGRPHRSLEALLEVRGMGPRLLARLRPFLCE